MARVPRFCTGVIVRYSPSMQAIATVQKRGARDDLRIIGSHHIYAKASENARISVPVHGNTPLKIDLLRHFMKVTGIEENEL